MRNYQITYRHSESNHNPLANLYIDKRMMTLQILVCCSMSHHWNTGSTHKILQKRARLIKKSDSAGEFCFNLRGVQGKGKWQTRYRIFNLKGYSRRGKSGRGGGEIFTFFRILLLYHSRLTNRN